MSVETMARSGNASPSMRELFEPAKLSLDKAPVLRGVFERFSGSCSELMRSLCAPPCTFMLNAVTTGNTWDLIDEFEDGICSIYYSPEWDARILIGFDRRFAASFTEAMFGGDGTEAPSESDRPFSSVEVRAMKEIFALAARGLEPLMGVIDNMSLLFERIETKLDFSSIGIADAPAIMAQLIAQVYEGGGRIFIIIPQSALIPFRRKLERERSPEPAQQDPAWAKQLISEIGLADVQMSAILKGPTLKLKELAALRIGDTMRLPDTIDSLVSFECAGEPLFRCKVGQSAGRFTVQIVHRTDQRQELINEIFAEALSS